MIVLRDVSLRYGPVQAVMALCLEVATGARVAIVGPSGSGKTSLLRLIAGLETPDVGAVEIDGRVVSTPACVAPPHQRSIGFAFQRPALWPHLSVRANLRFGMRGVGRREARRRVDRLADELRIRELLDRRPDALSGGEAQRAGLARALAPEPRRLLLDEPLAHLDPELRRAAGDLVHREVERTGATLLHVGHHPDETAAWTDERVDLEDGRRVPAVSEAVGP